MTGEEGATTNQRILAAAREVLARDAGAPVATVATAAGLSRATVHRHFRTRADLLAALDLEPDPDARTRVLAAAAELIAGHGLAALSMDDLAALAGVSRATVYRLFPGKAALVEALGADVVRYDGYTDCCGKATQDDQASLTMASDKMEAMRAHFEREAELEGPWTSYNASLGRPLLDSNKFVRGDKAPAAKTAENSSAPLTTSAPERPTSTPPVLDLFSEQKA